MECFYDLMPGDTRDLFVLCVPERDVSVRLGARNHFTPFDYSASNQVIDPRNAADTVSQHGSGCLNVVLVAVSFYLGKLSVLHESKNSEKAI